MCVYEAKAASADPGGHFRNGQDSGARAVRRRSNHEVRRIAGTEGGRLLHGVPGNSSLGGTRVAGGQGRLRGTRMAPGGCARDLLRDGLLPTPSRRAGASVANRPGRSARSAVHVLAPGDGKSTSARVTPTPVLAAHFSNTTRPSRRTVSPCPHYTIKSP